MEERARPRLDMDLVAGLHHVEHIERLYGRTGLAQRIAKAAEVVLAQKQLRALPHRFDIEQRADMPHVAALHRRRRAAVEDAIAIDAAARRAPRIEIVRGVLDAQHRYAMRTISMRGARRAAAS